MQIRPAAPADLPAITDIYDFHVLHGLASFEEEAPALEEIGRRHADVLRLGLPWLVAEDAGEVIGYGYCSRYRARPAYRHTLEDSVYIRDGRQGKGAGRALLGELIRRCEALNYRQMVAVIGDGGNAGSIALHARLGFVRAGVLRAVGYKLGRWVDSVLMQRPLGNGDGTKP